MKRKLSIIATIFAGIVLSGSAVAKLGREFNSRIAFVQRPDIFSMNPDGSDVRQLTNLGANNFAFWENWSPDGRQLVFSEFPNNSTVQLWLMNSDGSDQHLLLSESNYDEHAPSFSPDGVWVIFTRCEDPSKGNGCAIYKIRTDGGGLTPVTDFQGEVGDWEPVYSPDGMTIVFESYSRDGMIVALWLMNADGSDIRRLTPPELEAINPHWSPDNEKIAFTTHALNPQNTDLWVVNRDGHGLAWLTGSAAHDFDIPPTYYDRAPSWSPHGDAIVFDQYVPSTNTQAIFVMNADGSGIRQIMKLSAATHRVIAQTSAQELQGTMRRHRFPREIELGGTWARWSPDLQ
jgi:Tol biopolymer transport system component